MHTIWLGLILPLMIFLVWGFPNMRSRRIWMICLAITSVAIAGYVGFDLQQYLAGGGAAGDSLRRVIYKIVTATDLPLVAVWIGSLINWSYCCWKTDRAPENLELEYAQVVGQ